MPTSIQSIDNEHHGVLPCSRSPVSETAEARMLRNAHTSPPQSRLVEVIFGGAACDALLPQILPL